MLTVEAFAARVFFALDAIAVYLVVIVVLDGARHGGAELPSLLQILLLGRFKKARDRSLLIVAGVAIAETLAIDNGGDFVTEFAKCSLGAIITTIH